MLDLVYPVRVVADELLKLVENDQRERDFARRVCCSEGLFEDLEECGLGNRGRRRELRAEGLGRLRDGCRERRPCREDCPREVLRNVQVREFTFERPIRPRADGPGPRRRGPRRAARAPAAPVRSPRVGPPRRTRSRGCESATLVPPALSTPAAENRPPNCCPRVSSSRKCARTSSGRWTRPCARPDRGTRGPSTATREPGSDGTSRCRRSR